MNDNKKIIYASAKPTEELFGLFDYAQSLDVEGLGKAEILERAGRYLVKNKERINFNSISKSKFKTSYVEELPSSFKVRINDEGLDAKVNEILKTEYKISRIMTPFKLRIVLSAYINFLQNTERVVSKEPDTSIDTLRIKAISLALKADETLLNAIINLGGKI